MPIPIYQIPAAIAAIRRAGTGVCVGCGRAAPSPNENARAPRNTKGWHCPWSNHPLCPDCYEKRNHEPNYVARRAKSLEHCRKTCAENIRLGLCRCGRARMRARKSCENCLKNQSEAVSRYRKARTLRGLCWCGRPPRVGKSKCERCITKDRSRVR